MCFNLYICIYCSTSQTLCLKTNLHKVVTFPWVDLTGLQEKSQQVVKVQGLTAHVMATWLKAHTCFKTCGMYYHQMMVYVQEPLVGVVYSIYCSNQNKFGWYNKFNTLIFRIVSKDCVNFISSDEGSTTYTIDIILKCPFHMQVVYCQWLLQFGKLVIVTQIEIRRIGRLL